MHFIYNIAIQTYRLLVAILSLYNRKAKLRYLGSKETFARLENLDLSSENIWIHSASLGEFEQGRPFIDKLREENPGCKIILSFFSPSGYEVRKNYKGVDIVCYLPMDSRKNAQRFLDIVKPSMAIFIKYEFWANYLFELKKRNIPTYIISAIFRDGQVFFKPYGGFFIKVLKCFDRIFVQNDESKILLSRIGIDKVTVAGDTRFDRVADIAKVAKKLDFIERFRGNDTAIIAGSTWSGDEALLCRWMNENSGKYKMIIAPHEVSSERVGSITSMLECKYIKWSESESYNAEDNYDCLIIDTIGILSSVYQYGKIAYIGGGFGVGIHNTLEAAAWGMPVVFGPNYNKFQEAKDLIDVGAGFSIKDYEEMRDCFGSLLRTSEKESAAAIAYVGAKCGATRIILNEIIG